MRTLLLLPFVALPLTLACAHDPPPAPDVVHLDAPPIGDAGLGATPAPTGPFATIDIPVGDGKCPQPIHPGYCQFRCRSYEEREESHHAQRVEDPARYALGTCGPFKVFAEEDKSGTALIELYGADGALVASEYLKGEGCLTFLENGRTSGVTCTPKLDWKPSGGH